MRPASVLAAMIMAISTVAAAPVGKPDAVAAPVPAPAPVAVAAPKADAAAKPQPVPAPVPEAKPVRHLPQPYYDDRSYYEYEEDRKNPDYVPVSSEPGNLCIYTDSRTEGKACQLSGQICQLWPLQRICCDLVKEARDEVESHS